MGLDMYLYKRRYVKNWEHNKDSKWSITVKHNGKQIKDDMPVSYVTYDAGYWRKANAIHQWFIDHCANGDSDRTTMYVSHEQLKELLKTVRTVLAGTKLIKGKVINGYRYEDGKQVPIYEDGLLVEDSTIAEKYLPTQSGFFFGSTEYDQWYVEDLKQTEDILIKALANSDDCEFEYYASW